METKKISINLNYVFFVCMALIVMGGYQVISLNQSSVFNIAAIIITGTWNVMMLISCFVMYAVIKSNNLAKISEAKKEALIPNAAYFWLMIESAFMMAVSFSPESVHFRWVVYLLIAKWVIMFVSNALRIKLLKKARLP